ncbi:MAG: hypothetical protein RIR97_1617 [Pseudomonadota bacterium]|jgi:predicted N-acetyltransferase YhbS
MGFEKLTFRQDYYQDPKAWEALVDLLRDTFGIDVGLQMTMGGYDKSCMPFGWFDEKGVLVANLSAFTMPMMINGTVVKAAAFQSGAVRPDWQGQGLYRDVMRKAFQWSDDQDFDFGILLTDKPTMYEPYGFRTVPQTVFVAKKLSKGKKAGSSRHLSLNEPDDLMLLQNKLKHRTPVSNRFAVMKQLEMFLLNAAFDPTIQLVHLSQPDIIVALRTSDDGGLYLLDLVGDRIPALDVLVTELDIAAETIKLYFPPDQLACDFEPEAYQGYCALMIRSDREWPMPSPVILSPMAEF